MRHGEVAYFQDGRPLHAGRVPLTPAGRDQAAAAAEALAGIAFDRVLTSGLPRTLETAKIVAPAVEPESWPDLRELEGRFGEVPPEELERTYVGAFDGVVPEETRFLGGETIGSLFDRVIPALERLLADESWDVVLAVLHGGVNRAILSYAVTGERMFLGNLEQAPACIDVLDVSPAGWIVRAVNVTPYDPMHLRGRLTTMEELWSQFRST
jgi:broad specificity phosphatase PhoE